LAGAADFAASDVPMDAGQQRQAQGRCGGAAATIPATIGAVALIYNVPGVPAGLRFSPGLLAAIFLGRVANWSDPSIKAMNPGVRLPDLPIQVVHRSNGSGTTFILTNYLAAVSTAWRTGPGAGATVTWPVGTGVKGSAGIVQQVSTTLGALGYVDLAYGVQNNLTYARIQNAHGEFVSPSVEGASKAAAWLAGSMPADLQQIITNAAAPGAYPIAGYSYLILCTRQSGARGRAAVDFVRYAVTDGQEAVQALYYAPLPPSVERMDTAALDRIAVTP
jgi:phosphate transport system substrate-binding protein